MLNRAWTASYTPNNMKLPLLETLAEATYKGNIGMMEMFKFYQIASDQQKEEMKRLLADGKQDEAWTLLQSVTGTKLR